MLGAGLILVIVLLDFLQGRAQNYGASIQLRLARTLLILGKWGGYTGTRLLGDIIALFTHLLRWRICESWQLIFLIIL